MVISVTSTHRATRVAILALALAGAMACERAPLADAPEQATTVRAAPLGAPLDEARIARGRRALDTFECHRCHIIDRVDPPAEPKQCVGCHVRIERGEYEASAENLVKWQGAITHLVDVPALAEIGARYRRDWLVSFLQQPHDLRPRLEEQMPSFEMAPEQAEAIADYLIGVEQPERATQGSLDGDVARGKELVDTRGCGSCHAMSGATIAASPITVTMPPDRLALAMRLAPDLGHVRDRYRRDRLAAWLHEPSSVYEGTLMPDMHLSPQEARDIAAFLVHAPLATPDPEPVPERLPVLTRTVRYKEVSAAVFRKVCWHCHSDPRFGDGDGGPGNTGGLGFDGRALDLSTYRSIKRGMRGEDGQRVDVLRGGSPAGHDVSWIVAALMARHAEVRGHSVEGVRGMPLGLPPLSLTQIQLVESWIAQGTPR